MATETSTASAAIKAAPLDRLEDVAAEFAEEFGVTKAQARNMVRIALVAVADSRKIDTRKYCRAFGIR